MDSYNMNGNYNYGNQEQEPLIAYKDFYNRNIGKGSKRTVLAFVILLYINAGAVLVQVVATYMALLSWGMDASAYELGFFIGQAMVLFLSYLVLGILVHVKKNWIPALIVTCIFGINALSVLATDGKMTGVLVLILGVGSTIILYKMKKAYKAYITQGIWPQQYI